MHKLHISTQFDSGAIDVVRLERADDIQLRIRKDSAADFAQWFHFCLHGAAFQPVTLRFLNAGESAYPKGWDGYQVVASYDRQEWMRIDTQFDGQEMTARLTPMAQAVYFAYFEPYSYEQHLDLLASAATSPWVTQQRLGSTVQGRDMTLLRTNAAGANLNREWAAPTAERSPEVLLVRQAMLDNGVDLSLDVHGDEGLPYNVVAGSEGTPAYSPRVAALEDAFKASWAASCPDFQDRVNYGKTAPGQANMTLATHWIAQQFGCLAFTVEMPFKDNADLSDPLVGWSGERSKKLGASALQPLLQWSA